MASVEELRIAYQSQVAAQAAADAAALEQLAKAADASAQAAGRATDANKQAADSLAALQTQQQSAASSADAYGQAQQRQADAQNETTDSARESLSALADGAIVFATASRGASSLAAAQGGVAAAMRAAAATATPFGAALAGIGAAIAAAAIAVSAYNDETAKLTTNIRAVGREAEISTESLRNYIRALQAQGVEGAQGIVTSMARNPALSDATIGRISSLVPDASAALGVDAAAAASKLTEAFAGTYGGVKQLDDALNFLSVTERDQIRTMLEHGDRAGALDAEMKALETRIRGMDKGMTSPFEDAMRDLGASWRNFVDTVATDPRIQQVLTALTTVAGGALNTAAGVVTGATQQGVSAWLVRNLDPSHYGAWQANQNAAAMIAGGQVTGGAATVYGAGNGMIAEGALSSYGTPAANGVTEADQQRQLKLVQDLTAADRGSIQVSKAKSESQTELRATLLAEQEAADKGLTGAAREELIRSRVTAAIAGQSKATGDHARTIDTLLTAAEGDIKSQLALADAYDRTGASVAQVTATAKAEDEARKLAQSGHAADADQVAKLAQQYLSLSAAQEAVRESKNIRDQQDELDYIAKEVDLVGASVDVRARELAILKERQKVLAAGGDPTDPRAARDIGMVGDVAAAKANLDAYSATITQLQQTATAAFDQIGMAISNAFATGSAVKWGDVVKTTIASVMQQVIKLAVINPIVNSLLGTNQITAGSAYSALAGGASGAVNGTAPSLSGDLNSVLGLSLSGAKLAGYDLSLPSLSGALSTPLWGGTTVAGLDATGALAAGGANGMIAEGAISSAGTSAAGATTLGGLLGGAGLGFGAGTMLNSMLGGNQPRGMAGSGVGAAAGAAIGSVVPVIGTLIGGLIGGLAGGGLGGMFGPGAPSPAVGANVTSDNGRLVISSTGSAKMSPGDVAKAVAAVQADVDSLNSYLSSVGVQAAGVATAAGSSLISSGTSGSSNSNLAAAFAQLRFSGTGTVGQVINDKSFGSASELQAAIAAAKTYDALVADSSKVTGTFNDAIKAINTQYDAGIAQAKQYGLAEDALTAARQRAISAATDQVWATIGTSDSQYKLRTLQANGDTQGAAMLQESLTAQADLKNLADWWKSTFGDGYAAMPAYQASLADLQTAHQAEYAAIVRNTAAVNDNSAAAKQAAQQSIGGTIASLSAYAQSLRVGADSPLSPIDQLAAARGTFQSAASSASGGDYAAAQQLQSYAQSYLSTARTVYGSGKGYGDAVAQVANALQGVVSAGADALTASAMRINTQTQTATLVQQFQALKASVDGLRQDVRVAGLAPARAA